MKKNPICYMCGWCRECDKEQEEKCSEQNYILFATKEEKEMCNLMGCADETDVEKD